MYVRTKHTLPLHGIQNIRTERKSAVRSAIRWNIYIYFKPNKTTAATNQNKAVQEKIDVFWPAWARMFYAEQLDLPVNYCRGEGQTAQP